ncbi:hypothetical protein [Burkholderia cenocepacia]|uniref:hypothetical protein n=1 Tax=Burkholderia cenocepacia TaxID=95486 RepID=UPI0009817C1F|nr:hypothetical protein [Burkholderia cenocepacia]AQQ35073.1 hypothetical protein A8E96_23225 [Burkholderia cenocepacia]ONW32330.1 hypothetical protein A8E95_16290 [Burkholderia cenocepacia]
MPNQQFARGIFAGFGTIENPFQSPNGMEENLRSIDDHLAPYTLTAPVAPDEPYPVDAVNGDGQIYDDGSYAVYNGGAWKRYPAFTGITFVQLDGPTWTNTGSGWSMAHGNAVIETISELRSFKRGWAYDVTVLGYHQPADGFRRSYRLDESDETSPDNGGSVIVDAAGGRWKLVATDMMSVTDFGAVAKAEIDNSAEFASLCAAVGPYGTGRVGPGNWRIDTSPTTPITWLVDPNATFSGAGKLPGRIIKLSNSGKYSKGTKIGAQSEWLEGLRLYTESIAEVAVLSTIGQIGIIGASRTSDYGVAGSQGCIGISGYANNDNTTQIQTAYGGYIESRRQPGAGITQSLEIDIVNFGSVGFVYPGNVYPPDLTSCLWLASGGDVPGARGASLALGIIANGAPFDKAIVVQRGAVTSYFGEAVALALGRENGIVWYDDGTGKVARIRSDATAPSIGVVFSNSTLNLQDMSGNNVFTIGNNGVLNISKDTGGLYFLGTKVVGWRIAGWGDATGGSRNGFAAGSATLAQIAAALAQLIMDLKTHGLIGS